MVTLTLKQKTEKARKTNLKIKSKRAHIIWVTTRQDNSSHQMVINQYKESTHK